MNTKLTFQDLVDYDVVDYDAEMDEYEIITNDLFSWGCADGVVFRPNEDMEAYQKAFDDLDQSNMFMAGELFCARKVGSRPQGAFYSYVKPEYWQLFHDCGPEREQGFGNPHKPGEYPGPYYIKKEVPWWKVWEWLK